MVAFPPRLSFFPARSSRPWLFRAGLAALCLLLAGWVWHLQRTPPALRILLVTPTPAPEAGMDLYTARALASLVQDRMESHPSCAITPTTRMPSRDVATPPEGPWLLVIARPVRRGDGLRMVLHWSRQEGAYQERPLTEVAAEAPQPWQAVETAVSGLSFVRLPRGGRPLAALHPGAFWTWAELEGRRLRDPGDRTTLAHAQALLDQDRTVPAHWVTCANLQYRAYMNHPEQAHPRAHLDIQFAYQQALDLAPDLPRAAFLLSQVRTTLGAHHEALEDLRQQLAARPNHPLLLSGVAASSRCAGLLELSSQVQRRRDRLALIAYQPLVVDLGLLYTGEWPTLEARLSEHPGHLRQTIVLFYKGYLSLLQRREDKALDYFRRVQAEPTGYANYVRLAQAFQLILEKRPDEAREVLRAFRMDRVGLKVMDGELTFRIAEATALLGDSTEAIDLCRRAFAQGFCCIDWFERSPLIASLHGYSSYRSVLHQVRERQMSYAQRHPSSNFPR